MQAGPGGGGSTLLTCGQYTAAADADAFFQVRITNTNTDMNTNTNENANANTNTNTNTNSCTTSQYLKSCPLMCCSCLPNGC